ncbi:unnamed protein product [Prorocentrum cordatum]|uniref:Ion transport domain-containing protein n=1 Tax=Prorocentrum cordatum TaxID=2364126 RepID=A0ABN9PF28_9DINO|nr:unnamed protein product [Polarella glacialis]
MAARLSAPGVVSTSFEGLLQELDELRVRLLDQHRRELGASMASEADAPEAWDRTLQGPAATSRFSTADSREDVRTASSVLSGPETPAPRAGVGSTSTARRPAGPSEVDAVVVHERFRLLETWQDRVRDARLMGTWRRTELDLLPGRVTTGTIRSTGLRQDKGLMSRVVLHPQNPLVVVWNFLSVGLIAYESVTVPLYTCYTFQEFPKVIEIFDWVSRIFFTIDIPLSSATGFHDKGYVELRPGRVLQAYLTSWFFLDLLIVSLDWIVLVLEDQKALSAVPVLRGLRLVRVLRLMRLGRLSHVINESLLYASDGVTILVRISKLTLTLCITIHLTASIWYAIGTESSSGWLSQEPLLDSAALSAQYLVSVNWVVTQLHGTSLVRPQTLLEMFFQTLVLLGANAFVAVFFASTMQAMMALTDAHNLKMQSLCRGYLRRRRISPSLSHKLQLHFGPARSIKTTLRDSQEVENKLVEELPPVLRRRLYEEVRLPLLSSTRLCRTSGLSDYRLLAQLCCDAVSGVCAEPGELIFTNGDACTRMLVVESGTSLYVFEASAAVEQSLAGPSFVKAPSRSTEASGCPRGSECQRQDSELQRGRCLCEASLWTRWANRGELTAESYCTMLAVNQTDFASTLTKYELLCVSAVRYAYCYIVWLNEKSAEENVSDLTDAPVNLSEYTPSMVDASIPFVFISHFKEEAGSDAALMEEGISRIIKEDPCHPAYRLEAPTFLDSNNLGDLRLIRSIVRSSHNLLLLLTDRVLERPWVLIEIVTAMKSGVPIQLVQIQRPGVVFEFPTEEDINRLAAREGLSQDAKALLKAQKITSKDLRAIGQIFGNVALPFSPHRSPTVRRAELLDILARCRFDDNPRVAPRTRQDLLRYSPTQDSISLPAAEAQNEELRV